MRVGRATHLARPGAQDVRTSTHAAVVEVAHLARRGADRAFHNVADMNTAHIETVIIGAGQAGLSTGYHLKRRGREFVILDANARIGDNWRCHWNSLCLYTPAKYDSLPGLRFPGEPWSFPTKDDVGSYLESYAVHHDLPVRTSTRVESVDPLPDGGYQLTLDGGVVTCQNLVIATGTFGRTPFVPEAAGALDPGIQQLHSSEYKHPGQVQPGVVLVVGASHSGTDIAFELADTHPTILCGRDCGEIPIRLESRGMRIAFPVLLFLARHLLTRRTPIGRKAMADVRFHGGPMLRVKRQDLAARGVVRNVTRFVGTKDGMPLLEDGTVVDVANVIWATGFRQTFDWLHLPVLQADGWPAEYRGEVAGAPGLFFCGLSFQYAFASMLFPGIGRDADHVAGLIDAKTRDRLPARSAA
jgi:putative flavoprotein involved in K+ transport